MVGVVRGPGNLAGRSATVSWNRASGSGRPGSENDPRLRKLMPFLKPVTVRQDTGKKEPAAV